jgi:hypothetical protein
MAGWCIAVVPDLLILVGEYNYFPRHSILRVIMSVAERRGGGEVTERRRELRWPESSSNINTLGDLVLKLHSMRQSPHAA